MKNAPSRRKQTPRKYHDLDNEEVVVVDEDLDRKPSATKKPKMVVEREGVARRSAPVLAARFCSRERFWELLLGDGQSATPQRLTRMRLLGQQLQGMEAARARLLHRRARRSIQA